MSTKNSSVRWLYLVLGTASLLFGGIIYAWSILKAPLTAEFGWSDSSLSLNFTLTMCFFCIGGMAGGALLKKIGFKLSCIISAVLSAAGFILAGGMSGGIAMLYISYGLLAGLGIGIAYNCIISTVSAWFADKKGLCSGVLMMGFGASALILGSLADALISNESFGWRMVFYMLGAALGLMFLITAVILRAPKPGEAPAPKPAAGASSARDYTTGEMLRSITFWKAFILVVFLAAVGNTVISMARDLALSVGAVESLATLLVGVLSVCNGLGRVITGAVFDRFGRKTTMIGANIVAIFAAGLTLLAVFTSSTALCVVGLCLTGISYGSCPTISSAFISEVFGSKYFAMNFPIMNCNLVFASLIATGTSLITAATNGYSGAFILLLALSVIALFLNLSLRRER